MDPHLRRLGSKWLLQSLALYFIVIYRASPSWGIERINLSKWDEFNNSESSGIKLQKWDTDSQGGQDLWQHAAVLETNTSSAFDSSSTVATTSNPVSVSSETMLTSTMTIGSDQSSAATIASNQSAYSNAPSSKSPNSTMAPSQSRTRNTQSRQLLTSTAPSSQTSTNTVPVSQPLTKNSLSSGAPTSQPPAKNAQSNTSSTITEPSSKTPTNTAAVSQLPNKSSPSSLSLTSRAPASQPPTKNVQSNTSTITEPSSKTPINTAAVSQPPNKSSSSSQSLTSRAPASQPPTKNVQSNTSTITEPSSKTPINTAALSQPPNKSSSSSQSLTSRAPASQPPTKNVQSNTSSTITEPSSKTPINTAAVSQIPNKSSPSIQSLTSRAPASQPPTKNVQSNTSSRSIEPSSQTQTNTAAVSQPPNKSSPSSQSLTSRAQASQPPTKNAQSNTSSTSIEPSNKTPISTVPVSETPTSTVLTQQSPTNTLLATHPKSWNTPSDHSPTSRSPHSQYASKTSTSSQSSTNVAPSNQPPAKSISINIAQSIYSPMNTTPASWSLTKTLTSSQSLTSKLPNSHSEIISQSPTKKGLSSQSSLSIAPTSQSSKQVQLSSQTLRTSSTAKHEQSSSNEIPSNQSEDTSLTANQLLPSSVKIGKSPTSSDTSTQSPRNKASPNQSSNTLIPSSLSLNSSKTSHQQLPSNFTSSQLNSPSNQSWARSSQSKQIPLSSLLSGNAASRSSSVEEHPANTSLLARHLKEAAWSTFPKFPESCEFSCLNGGQCLQSQLCDCSLFQATGHRCQTVPNPGFEREMTCRTWGQYNFETFDGLYYYFPGRCTYTLLRDCEETTQASIVVQVHNDPVCESDPYICQRSLSLFLPWEGEVQLHSSKVTFKGQRLQLPHYIHDLQLEQISQYVLVTQQHGFTLAWEGHSGSAYIKLSPEFVGRTCGLCGNFNADVQDDLKTSYGVLTDSVEMFGNSWLEAEPHQTQCSMVPSGFPSPCVSVDAYELRKVEEVCAMLLELPFQSCHDFVSPLSYMASCSNDLCMSGPNGDVVCQVFTEYARACAHADHPLHKWRQHIPQCVKQCPSELGYKECISCCPVSCNLERTCIDSNLACLDGCYCPDGLIYEEGSCVMPSDCPCEYHGMIYPSGHTLQEECNNCTCVGGVWNCTEYNCPGECSVTGDIYFNSFDGRIFSFSATCQYVLAKSRNSGKFTVTVQNAPCGANLDGACIQSVNLVIDEDPRTEITLSHVGEVFMAGQYRISLPYSDDIFHIEELSSMFLQVKTKLGLHLNYSWKDFRLYLEVDELWKDDTLGLCGTFNGNIQDDFLSPSGMIESTPQLFGNSWRVSSACSPSLSTSQLDPCDTHQQAVAYAFEMCDILNNDLFSGCHEYLSPTPFHHQCRSDTCKCGTPCLCSALAHYARQCRRFSIIINFRLHVPDCAVTCPANMQYGTCVSSCQRRCSALSVPQHCGEECEEGCACPQGSFYNHRTHTCVHRSECPCRFLGADYEPGDVIMTSAGVQLCLNGKLISQTTDQDRVCPPGQLYQNCSEGEDGLLPGRGLACERTCESFLLNLTCSTHEPCVAGCACPPGLLKHGDECFELTACPCLWKGKEYYPGDRVSSSCHDCVCQHGTFQCVFRPCPSMCTTYGDRHYRTFDGLLFDFVGACKVYLIKSSVDVTLSVAAENIGCFDSGATCRKSVLITIGKSFIAFDDDTGKPSPFSVIDRKQSMFIWPAGYFTVIHFPDEHVTVLWDRKTTVHIQVGPRWQGKLSGLCGNFDLKTVNEMKTPENIDSTTPQEFGNSWTAAECVNSPDIRHPCSLSPLREPFAKQQCGILLSEVFQACHPVVDVTWFYMNCLSDTCACSRGGDCECFCTSVAAYAQRCCHQGVPVDWRSPSLCPYDCEFYNKVLGKGPFRLITFRYRTALLAASKSGGAVFLHRGNGSAILSHFMITPGLSRARPHDTSRVSFEAADRPNYFLYASPSGQVKLCKWEENKTFWEGATFIVHRNTWIPGYDSLESHAKRGFFLHSTVQRIHLLKYRHTDSFRKATLFKLTGTDPDTPPGPRCQWRYDSCVSPCFKTCSNPSAEACVTIPQVEGCFPVCPPHMVLDEVTHRCVYVEDCINVIAAVQPTTAFSAWQTSAPFTLTTTTTTASTTSAITSVMPLHTAPTTKVTTTLPVIDKQTTITKVPLQPDEPQQPLTTSSLAPELPGTATLSSLPTIPDVVEPRFTVRMTEIPTSTVSDITSWTTKVLSSTIIPSSPVASRTDDPHFAITTLFWITGPSKSTDSPLFTSSATTPQTSAAPSTSSVEGQTSISPSPHAVEVDQETTEVTTPSEVIIPIVSTTTSGPAPVSEYSTVKDRITVPKSMTTGYTETSTKPVTVSTSTSKLPGLSSTSATLPFPFPTLSPVETKSVSLPIVTLMKTTESVTKVVPFTIHKTTPYKSPEVTVPLDSLVSTEQIRHRTDTEQTSTTAAPGVQTLTPVHVAPTTIVQLSPTSSSSDGQTIAKEMTTVSKIPTFTTTTIEGPPMKVADTTAPPPLSSPVYTERTSWSASVLTTTTTTTATTRATQITTSSSPEVPETSTLFTGPLVTTKQTLPPVTPAELTTSSLLPTKESSTHSPSTVRTSKPHWDTSITPTIGTTELKIPEVTSVISPTTTQAPHLLITKDSAISTTKSTSATAATVKMTPPKIPSTQFTLTTTSKPDKPHFPTLSETPETPLTTVPTKAVPSAVTTVFRPVTIQPVTEMRHPLTGRTEVSTTVTVTPPPSWSPLHTTTSTPGPPRPTTFPDKVTTRVVFTARTTPTTTSTITRTPTLRTTPRVPLTTRVTPRITTTERSTIAPVTPRVTVTTRTTVITTKSPTRVSPTFTSPVMTTVSRVPSTNITTSDEAVQTLSTTKHAHVGVDVPSLSNITAPVPVSVPLLTVAPLTAVPTVSTRESTTSEKLPTKVSPTTAQLVKPQTTHKPSTASSTASLPMVTTFPTAVPDVVDHTSAGITTASPPTLPHTTPVKTARYTAEDTSVVVLPTRICTPPYAEFIDECTKYICVNNQLVLFNKSQSCPFTSEPPNCGLRGFAVLVNGDKCCSEWGCPCINVIAAVQPTTAFSAWQTSAPFTLTTTTTTASTTSAITSVMPLHTAPTTKVTTTLPVIDKQTTITKGTATLSSLPTIPDVVEPRFTVRMTEIPTSTVSDITSWTTKVLSSTIIPSSPVASRTDDPHFAITTLFWITGPSKSTDLPSLHLLSYHSTDIGGTFYKFSRGANQHQSFSSCVEVDQETTEGHKLLQNTASSTASLPMVTTFPTAVPDVVDHTSAGITTASPPTLPHTTPVKTARYTAEDTSVVVLPTRICTPPYAEFIDECTKYICVNNQLVLFNKSQSCPFTSEPPNCGLRGFAVLVNGDKCCSEWGCPCRCSVFPDLSVITFDGNSVAIYKAALYIITQLPNETVSVLVQECPTDSESTFLWNFTNLCLVALNISHKSNHVVINRLQRRLYVNSRHAKPRFRKFGFEIYDTGNMYLIRTPNGLKLQWYHSTGMMVVDSDNSSNNLPVMGLCGFCDGDPSNDLTLANGTIVSDAQDPAVFINSWQVPNTTSYIGIDRHRKLNCSTSDCSHCFDLLQTPSFSSCHAFVPPATFCEIWVRDEEYVSNHCVALAAYVASCHKFNICIEWRSAHNCPFLCPGTLRYKACLPACTAQSCPNHDFDSDLDHCSGLTEGCVCPVGTLLHRPYTALCIPPDKCDCTDSSGVPRSHGEVWKASKDSCCMYRCDNDTIVSVEYNCSSIVPPVCRRSGEVIISLSIDTSCCPQKLCVCNQSLCDFSPPDCKYGEKLVSYYRQDSCCPDYVCVCDPDLCESDIPTCREDQTLIATRADGSCCLAYICMCSSCSEAPPLCQDGEVLTVEGNTTERCCPTFQCVCERYRCPQLTCPIGMSAVSMSTVGPCCPNTTCECACEKIISPKCGLGEYAQLDQAFLSDPQNKCLCKRYKCVREAVCVYGDRGVLRPGQTLVERSDDGLCYSRQCSRSLDPASGFHLLRTISSNCSTHCLPNQIYIPPKDQSTCCGVCKNISCLYQHENGSTVLYKPGRSWVSNCMKFDCADTMSGPTLISYSFSCPPFNETDCMKIGGTIVSYMDGCCRTCKEDGKSCQKVTVRMTIRKNDCRSNRPVNIVSCDGKCPSASIYNYNINTYARFCKCCRETGLQRRSVQLYCSNNATWISYTIQEPTDCACQWS
ncbi:otogelin [Thalassophryne amazonica]|uniref:otogelin n=1 Tax=Thalassophryne amazonica TaxID=390379 RepID=UPI001471B95E|nr:otogelin [Thalassophryne amazonica]